MSPIPREPEREGTIGDRRTFCAVLFGGGRRNDGTFGRFDWVAEWWKARNPVLVDDFDDQPDDAGDWVARSVAARYRRKRQRLVWLLETDSLDGAALEEAYHRLETLRSK